MLSESTSFEANGGAQDVTIEGARINLPTPAVALSRALDSAERGEGFTLFTLNLDHLVKLTTDAAFHAAYRHATFVSADGWPVVWLAGRRGVQLERTTGSDMVEPLCQGAAARGLPLYFVGPGPKAQASALDILTKRFAGLRVAGAEAPKLATSVAEADLDAMAERINASGARLCFLSLGAPKQEILAHALAPRCPRVGFVCVGAALDFISGEVRRAPPWMQRIKLEWLWRVAGDPRRLAVRYAQCAVVFARLALGLNSRRPAPVATAEPFGAIR